MHLVPTFSTNSRGNTCYIRATQFLCWLKVQTFVSWFSDPLLAHLRLWLKRKIERCFSFTLLALVFHWRLSWKFGGLRFFEERETDQRFFSLVYLLGKQQTFANNKWLETDIIFVVQGSEESVLHGLVRSEAWRLCHAETAVHGYPTHAQVI